MSTLQSRIVVKDIMTEIGSWIKDLAERSEHVCDPPSSTALERQIRQGGQRMLGKIFQRLMQHALDRHQGSRSCPHCGGRRRHKGRRERGLISSVGAIRLEGPYWYCPVCRKGQHAVDTLSPQTVSPVMRELLCLLGTALTSFSKGSQASKALLGISVSDELIRTLCRQEGFKALGDDRPKSQVTKGSTLIGSCDGTMVNTRQWGWRELKAYQFRYGDIRHGRAYLERAQQFMPRVRKAAIALKAGQAKQLFFVSDAASWIEKGVRVSLPTAIRIIDIWHAYQHIHEAARKIYGEQSPQAKSWAKQYCDLLLARGGQGVWDRLRRVRYRASSRQKALEELLGYLRRNADRMDYPFYQAENYPISSGPMESFCKQLGLRLKGPGMRWSTRNVNPMAVLVSLWANDEWNSYWTSAA